MKPFEGDRFNHPVDDRWFLCNLSMKQRSLLMDYSQYLSTHPYTCSVEFEQILTVITLVSLQEPVGVPLVEASVVLLLQFVALGR
jgi:hypothetical protein